MLQVSVSGGWDRTRQDQATTEDQCSITHTKHLIIIINIIIIQ